LANHKSALKRARQNENNRIRNKSAKSRVRSVIKDIRSAVISETDQDTTVMLNQAKSVIDRAAQKGCLHRRTAARKISRISKLLNASVSSLK
jgi:small subunit ribosomal protein S20